MPTIYQLARRLLNKPVKARQINPGRRRQPMTINIFALTNAVLLAVGMVYLAAAF